MNKYFYILTLLSFPTLLFSQILIEIEPDTIFQIGNASEEEINLHTSITNTSDNLVTVAWERIVNDLPEAWESYICSDVVCTPPDIGFGTFGLASGNTVDLDCYFLPHQVGGQGIVELRLFITADTITKYYVQYELDALPVAIKEAKTSPLKIYPNPAIEYLFLENIEAIGDILIYDIYGSIIKKEQFEYKKRIFIGNLNTGNYILQWRSEGQVRTGFFQKQ